MARRPFDRWKINVLLSKAVRQSNSKAELPVKDNCERTTSFLLVRERRCENVPAVQTSFHVQSDGQCDDPRRHSKVIAEKVIHADHNEEQLALQRDAWAQQ